MTEPPIDQLARQACVACRKQKRRCSREIPACELCRKNRRACDYYAADRTPSGGPAVVQGDQQQQQGQGSIAADRNAFPKLFFLDSWLFRERKLALLPPAVPLPLDCLALLGDADQTERDVDLFFRSVHGFLPIVSKLQLQRQLRRHHPADPGFGGDIACLLLAMRLHCCPVDGVDGPSSPFLYGKAKQSYGVAEAFGCITLRLLQAVILVGLYEVANGIYPAAYITVGQCARIGHALGLHDRTGAELMFPSRRSWTEVEEMRRTWWAVIVLDRYVNIGFGGNRPFACADARPEDLLPIDEAQWDSGEQTATPSLAISASTAIPVPPFARTCQAAHLLSRVLGHVGQTKPPDYHAWYSEGIQIHRVLEPFCAALWEEMSRPVGGGDNPASSDLARLLPLCSGMGLCFSAQIALYETHTCAEVEVPGIGIPEQLEMQQVALPGLKDACGAVRRFACLLGTAVDLVLPSAGGTSSPALLGVSPLVCDCLYAAAKTYRWYISETGQDELASFPRELEAVLRLLGRKWNVANEYLSILAEET